MGLVAKLTTIMGELGNVPKEGFNKAQNYKFVREADVVAKLVPLLAKHRVYLHTTVVEHSREPLYQTQSGLTMWLDRVTLEGTWIDGDSGETLPAARFVGTGADTGDKGVFKAQTGAEKYLLLKSLLISTGDDPEADEKVDTMTAAKDASSGTRITRSQSASAVGRGGKSDGVTEAQIDEIARQARRAKLMAADLLPVIDSTIGRGPTDPAEVRNFLKTLTADEAGKLVITLTDLAEYRETGAVTPEGAAIEVV